MIHVAHIVTSFDTGGLQNGVVNIINHSDASVLRHTVVSLRSSIGLAERLRGGEVISIGLEAGRHPLAFKTIAKRLKSLAPDVVHTRNWGTYPDGMAAAVSAGVRRRIHGYHGRDLSNAHGERLRRRIIGKILGGLTDRIITLTPTMRREYARDFWMAERRIEVIPNGVDFERLDRFVADEQLKSSFTVVAVGRLDAVKNYPMLVEAFAKMPGRAASDRLVFAGDGPERGTISRAIDRCGVKDEVQLTGERKDIPAVLKAADVFVQPSYYEGMSNTIVEAMACGVPVVATDVGGNGDVAGRDGTAVLVTSNDVGALASALGRLRADESMRRTIARAGAARARDAFSLRRMVNEYTRVYVEVAQGRPVPSVTPLDGSLGGGGR